MRAIPFFRTATPLTAAERMAKRRLVLQDTLALLTIFVITCVLAVLTWLLFRSYSQHQSDAAARWKRRGDQALAVGNANAAVFDLRAALAYAPGDRGTEIELAGALALAGNLQEATAYFNTLWDEEPGSGVINLQLARLAARQRQMATALEHYHGSIYGTWEGDGTVRRRQVRLELVRYLIQQSRFAEARDELLIAAGNDTSTPAVLEVAALLEQAHAPLDALRQYREVASRHPPSIVALEGAGQSAFMLGRYRTARTYLERALAAQRPLINHAAVETNLREADGVLAAYPSPQLPQRERLRRVVHAHDVARMRYLACARQLATAHLAAAPVASPAPAPPAGRSLASRLNLLGDRTAQSPSDKVAAQPASSADSDMTSLATRWNAARPRLEMKDLEENPQFEQAEMQLVYDTEQITSHVCGQPTGTNAALLRIATSPETVDQ